MKRLNRKGVTLIELLIALVICGMVAAGIYQVFIAQSKAYTVQEQVTEVQQSVRSAMEIMLRDLRMAGFDNDSLLSTVTIPSPIANLGDSDITVIMNITIRRLPNTRNTLFVIGGTGFLQLNPTIDGQ
jgi:prepilin-type N-terminal cleavage/methylation domain-containing protein